MVEKSDNNEEKLDIIKKEFDIKKEEIETSKNLIEELFNEVKTLEEPQGPAQRSLGRGGKALNALKEIKTEFGDPNNDLVAIKENLFIEKFSLNDIQKKKMQEYDFYYMTLNFNMHPGDSNIEIEFSRLICQLDFELLDKNKGKPIIHSMLPKSEWRDILSLDREIKLSINGDLEWELGIDSSDGKLDNLPGKIRTQLSNKNNLNANFSVPSYKYSLKKAIINASGEGSDWCRWKFENVKIKDTGTIKFGLVFKVPRGIKKIKFRGIAKVEPKRAWLISNISDITRALSDKFRELLNRNNVKKFNNEVFVGDHKEWTLNLPR